MELTEQLFDDKRSWSRFVDDENGDICTLNRCPECGKYITKGKVKSNGFGNVIFSEFKCKKHGEVNPFYLRD